MSFETACHNGMQSKQESATFGGMTQERVNDKVAQEYIVKSSSAL